MVDPEPHDTCQFLPEGLPIRRVEVDRVNVFVTFGRVFCVPDAAVGKRLEPVGVLCDPRMVRRALEGDIEGHLDPELVCFFHEAVEVREIAELWMNGAVPTFFGTDGPRAARIPGRCHGNPVGTLAVRSADGMYRWEIEHVEAELCNVGKESRCIEQGPVPARLG